ncbi:aldo/keto reductase [Agromyces rhizosphaerae]|uniref:Aldo/keto reductase n=1 Tax=Agromyces rhizosphaerae TaxID=88374 RepID=A0A9W6FPA6_9MICO|nr:aldo/keto reductase [Agromyces rhizosphaerae]GLI27824.1 aldo/keto reductase [Agromyces rhizosphaerae]
MTMHTALPTVPLGTTGMDVTRVGFGAWAIGGGDWAFAWGAQDDDASVAAILHAVERGVNWIDTASVYGLGHSEEVVGRALAALPADDRPYVFTKGGMQFDLADRRRRAQRVGAPAAIKRHAEESLARLGVERIDLFQMHWPADDGTPIEEYWNAFVELRDEGKVRAIGLSNHSVAQLEAAEAVGHVDTLQPPFSAIAPATADELLPWCVAHDTGVIVYSPMGSGLLTGAFDAERVASLPEDDWRRSAPAFTTDLEQNLRIADALARVAERHGVPQPAAAAAWTLGFDGVTAAIVGARSEAQIEGWLPASSLALTDEDYAEVAAARA